MNHCSLRAFGKQTMKPWMIFRGKGINVDPAEAAEHDKLGI